MNTLQLCSIYYTVAVSFDRFLYLTYGIQAETICNVRNSLRIIGVITIFSILFILPYWFKYRTVLTKGNRVELKCKDEVNLIKILIFVFCLVTRIGDNELYRQIIHIWLYIPIVYAVPFLLLIFINFFTIKLLHKFYVNRRRTLHLTSPLAAQNNEQHERDITLMLIGVVLLFFICRFPMLINHIFETKVSITSYESKGKKHIYLTKQLTYNCRTRYLFNSIVNFLQAINASANLFFYYLFGESFRETSFQLAKLVRKRAIRRRNTAIENMSYYMQRRRTSGNTNQQNSISDQQQEANLLTTKEENLITKNNLK